MTLVLFTHRRTYHPLLFLPVHVLVLFLESVCLLSLSLLLFYRMDSESRGELISPSKQPPDTGKRYIEKNLDAFGLKILYSSNPQLCGHSVGVPVAVVLKDIGLIPGPTDAVVYLTVLYFSKCYVCTGPRGGITGD